MNFNQEAHDLLIKEREAIDRELQSIEKEIQSLMLEEVKTQELTSFMAEMLSPQTRLIELYSSKRALEKYFKTVQVKLDLSTHGIFDFKANSKLDKNFHKNVLDVLAGFNKKLIQEKQNLNPSHENTKQSKNEMQQPNEEKLRQIQSEITNFFLNVSYACCAGILPITRSYFEACNLIEKEDTSFMAAMFKDEIDEQISLLKLKVKDIIKLFNKVIIFALENKLYHLAQLAYADVISILETNSRRFDFIEHANFVTFITKKKSKEEGELIEKALNGYDIVLENITLKQLEFKINAFFAKKELGDGDMMKFAKLILDACFNGYMSMTSPIFLREAPECYAEVLDSLVRTHQTNLKMVYKFLLAAAFENGFGQCVTMIEEYKESMRRIAKISYQECNVSPGIVDPYFNSYPSIAAQQEKAKQYENDSLYLTKKVLIASDDIEKFDNPFATIATDNGSNGKKEHNNWEDTLLDVTQYFIPSVLFPPRNTAASTSVPLSQKPLSQKSALLSAQGIGNTMNYGTIKKN